MTTYTAPIPTAKAAKPHAKDLVLGSILNRLTRLFVEIALSAFSGSLKLNFKGSSSSSLSLFFPVVDECADDDDSSAATSIKIGRAHV